MQIDLNLFYTVQLQYKASKHIYSLKIRKLRGCMILSIKIINYESKVCNYLNYQCETETHHATSIDSRDHVSRVCHAPVPLLSSPYQKNTTRGQFYVILFRFCVLGMVIINQIMCIMGTQAQEILIFSSRFFLSRYLFVYNNHRSFTTHLHLIFPG